MGKWQIEPLTGEHDRSTFRCGKPSLDEFLQRLVTQYEKRNIGRTFVLVEPPDSLVLGYYTLASSSVPFANVPTSKSKKLPKHPVPVVLLARLAVDLSRQGTGMGTALLVDALRRALALSRQLGIHAVEVDAIDADAKAFYERFGFVPMVNDLLHLFLPIAVIEKEFGAI